MATYQPVESRLILKLQTGADEWGRPKVSSKSISGVDAAALADNVDIVANALVGLLSVPLYDTQKEDTDTVVPV